MVHVGVGAGNQRRKRRAGLRGLLNQPTAPYYLIIITITIIMPNAQGTAYPLSLHIKFFHQYRPLNGADGKIRASLCTPKLQ
jgi:hypothetical protein